MLQASLAGAIAVGAVLPLACSTDDASSSTTTPTATVTPTAAPDAAPPDSGGPGVAGPTDQATNAFAHPAGDVNLGRDVFRFETFGNEGFWTRVLKLPQGMKAAGVTPLKALALGICVDIEKVPAAMVPIIAAELETDLSPANAPALNNPATTEALIEANAVIGVSARNITLPLNGTLDVNDTDVYAGESVGITCAFCHSITDGSVYKPAAGKRGGTIGKRVDGPTNHDLEVGKGLAAAQNSRAYYPTLALDLAANKPERLRPRAGPKRSRYLRRQARRHRSEQSGTTPWKRISAAHGPRTQAGLPPRRFRDVARPAHGPCADRRGAAPVLHCRYQQTR